MCVTFVINGLGKRFLYSTMFFYIQYPTKLSYVLEVFFSVFLSLFFPPSTSLFSPALSMSLLVHYVCFYFSARHVFLLFSFYLIISIHSSSPSILFNNEDEIVIALVLFFDALKYRMFEMLFCFSNRILYSERRRDRLRDVFIKKWCL